MLAGMRAWQSRGYNRINKNETTSNSFGFRAEVRVAGIAPANIEAILRLSRWELLSLRARSEEQTLHLDCAAVRK
jgi:hypothetical protein